MTRRILFGVGSATCAAIALLAACTAFSGTSTSEVADASDEHAGLDEAAPTTDGGAVSPDGGAPEGIDAGGTPGIACNGSLVCEAGAQTCCANPVSGELSCKAITDKAACENNSWVDCDDWLDCASAGLVCCGLKSSNGLDFYTSECTTLPACQVMSPVPVVVCAPGTQNPCPNGAACEVPDGGHAGFCVALP